MKKFVVMALTGLALTAPAFVSAAQAEDAVVATEVTTETTATETTATATETTDVVDAKLADGTHVRIKGTNVFVVDAAGTETAAPDGVHTLEDGKTVETKDGVIVAPVAAE